VLSIEAVPPVKGEKRDKSIAKDEKKAMINDINSLPFEWNIALFFADGKTQIE
jgi:hypothetical protein